MRTLLALLLAAGLLAAQGAPGRACPYVGYLCAAGGQRGQTVRIVAGGQNLRGAREVIVSGGGVHATVAGTERAPWLLKPDDRGPLTQYLRQLARARMQAEAPGRRTQEPKPPPGMPDLPMLRNVDALTVPELRRVAYEYLDPARRSQLSAQIAETVEIDVTIDADAEPGDRELRVRTPAGLSNPVLFEVGTLPEYAEREPNDYRTAFQPPADPPCVFNGQVTFKDRDRFRFRASRGQKLVIEVQARRLVPYIADAVPGWFQATLTLFDEKGQQIAFDDDDRFDPDPVLLFEVPADGFYEIEIRDALYRGREDFVYRVTVAERPFVRSMFPLGGREGIETTARLDGWNLAQREVPLDAAPGGGEVRTAAWARGDLRSNEVAYAVGNLPECTEERPDLTLPVVVNGRIAKAGEADRFRFEGRAGQDVVAEVCARRLGSPLDSLLQLTDASGRVLAWNDDHEDKAAGLVTHQADSYLRATLPADGTYAVLVRDAEGHGGPDFTYRLRVSAPRPDFTVIVTPASINVPAGAIVPITVDAVRRDGYAGEIELALDGAPPGMTLSGATIPAGCDRVRMTLAAPPPARNGRLDPFALRIRGRATIDGRTVEHDAVPAEEMMQAFGLLHLVPAQQLMVDVLRTERRPPPMRLAADGPARIPLGGTVEVRIDAPGLQKRPANMEVKYLLDAPPDGVTLADVRGEGQALVLVLAADRGKAKPGLAGNLIPEARVEISTPPEEGEKPKRAAPQRRAATVTLPAVPFLVVE
jgi:hypothetical protein